MGRNEAEGRKEGRLQDVTSGVDAEASERIDVDFVVLGCKINGVGVQVSMMKRGVHAELDDEGGDAVSSVDPTFF